MCVTTHAHSPRHPLRVEISETLCATSSKRGRTIVTALPYESPVIATPWQHTTYDCIATRYALKCVLKKSAKPAMPCTIHLCECSTIKLAFKAAVAFLCAQNQPRPPCLMYETPESQACSPSRVDRGLTTQITTQSLPPLAIILTIRTHVIMDRGNGD